MRRRTFLAAAGSALFGGCLGTAPTGGSTPTPGGTTTDPAARGSSAGEFVVSGFDVSTTKVAPPARYYLRITAVYSTDAVEREPGQQTVRDVSEVEDPDLRAAVETVLAEGKVWREEVPDGLRSLVDRVDFFTWEANTDPADTATHWGVDVYRASPDRDPVVEFDAELVDDRLAAGDPGAIAFSLSNVGDRTQSVFSGTVPPFSVLWADGPDDDRALLWRDYAEEGCVTFGEMGDEPTMYRCDIGVTTAIEPGETIERRYELHPSFDRPAIADRAFDTPGEYAVNETLSYRRDGEGQGPSTEVDWTVEFALEEP